MILQKICITPERQSLTDNEKLINSLIDLVTSNEKRIKNLEADIVDLTKGRACTHR